MKVGAHYARALTGEMWDVGMGRSEWGCDEQ